jgi:hypothetical protein
LTRIAQSAVNLSAAAGGLGEPTEPARRPRRTAARRNKK